MKAVKTYAFALAAVSALAIASHQESLASSAQQELAAENFLQADANEDGALTMSEFTTLIDLNAEDNLGRAKMVQRLNKYGTAFGRMDANADGLVTTDEISAMRARAQQ